MYLTKEQLYESVEACRNNLLTAGIQYPISIFDVASRYQNIDLECVPFTTPGLRGMVALATSSEPVNCILINSHIPDEEKNFHGIHELLHIHLHSNVEGKTFHCYDKIKQTQDYTIEWQANEGAAELLVPYKDFIPTFYDMLRLYCENSQMWVSKYGHASIYTLLASRYGVSEKVVMNRISSLAYEIDQYSSGVCVDRINLLSYTKRQRMGIEVTDYLNIIRKNFAKKCFSIGWDAVLPARVPIGGSAL